MEKIIVWHHGTCDLCDQQHTLVCHFNYSKQQKRDCRVCLKCFFDNAQSILYGWMDYKVDKTIDNLSKEV